MKNKFIIDAKGQKIGRLASSIAKILRGKNSPDFLPHGTKFPSIEVINANEMIADARRLKAKQYQRYSGYPSGRKLFSALEVWKKNPGEVLRKAVFGMLPKNRQRAHMIRQLTINNGKTK